MRLFDLTFRDDPAAFTSQYIVRSGIDPLRTLIVAPSQRFKSYLASALLQRNEACSSLSPTLITNANLIHAILAMNGKPLANEMEKLTMLYYTCSRSKVLMKVFPEEFIANFTSFRAIARRLIRSFEELGREEIDIRARLKLAQTSDSLLLKVQEQAEILRDLWECYYRVQTEKDLYDESFLMGEITQEDIQHYFTPYDTILMVSPLSLTRFERRIFKAIKEKLTVIYQDTKDYDFSRIITFRGDRKSVVSGRGAQHHFYRAPNRMAQVMLTLSILQEEIARGIEPHEIAVINSDSQFSQMLFDSLQSMEITTNFSEGLSITRSPLFHFLSLVQQFFESDLDTQIFLQLLQNDIFLELSSTLWTDSVELRGKVQEYRIFKLPSLEHPFIANNKSRREAFSLIGDLYKSQSFRKLYENLLMLFNRLNGKKTYDFYTVRDILLDSALELEDLSILFQLNPLQVLLQLVKSKKYPLPGVYRRGVQIVGLLESRGITFRKVIVPSFNEGYFPVKNESDILLPIELRKKLGLPTFLDREELEFYYLRRVVDASEDAFFISITDSSGEIDVMSRYAYLINGEGTGEEESHYTFPVRTRGDLQSRPPIHLPAIPHPIREFSRLDIERIKRCETQYYIAKILRIPDVKELKREVESHIVGQRVHLLLSELYRDVDFNSIDAAMVEDRLLRLFDTYFTEGYFFTREEDLIKKILIDNLRKSLLRDIERFNDGYCVCAEYMEREFRADLGNYRLTGRIDRIDLSPTGSYSIIDYKTGSVPEKRDHLAGAAFKEVQLGFYALLFKYNFPEAPIESLCYFDLNNRNALVPIIEVEEIDAYLNDFESHLIELLDHFNSKDRLSLTDDLENCRYCPYFNICRINEE